MGVRVAKLAQAEMRCLADRSKVLFDPQRCGEPVVQWFQPRYWQAQGRLVGCASGRGQVSFVSGDDETQWALRHYRRGGMVGRMVRRYYLYTGAVRVRSWAEFRLLSELAVAGLPVPQPVAARYRRSGGLWYQADLITERLLNTRTLTELIVAQQIDQSLWSVVGATIRRFHDAGVDHADLNAHNILCDPNNRCFLIDFDRCHMRAAQGSWGRANLARLRRSLEKIVPAHLRSSLPQAWKALQQGYQSGGGSLSSRCSNDELSIG